MAVKAFVREIRPPKQEQFERRFETPPGKQAKVDFAKFAVEFTNEPWLVRKVWLFCMVPGHSRWLWGQFCASQNLQTVLRCHLAAFTAKPHEKWGETPCAFVKLASGETVAAATLRAWCKDQLAPYKVPGHFMSIPRTSPGKIQKFALRDQAKEIAQNANAGQMAPAG